MVVTMLVMLIMIMMHCHHHHRGHPPLLCQPHHLVRCAADTEMMSEHCDGDDEGDADYDDA